MIVKLMKSAEKLLIEEYKTQKYYCPRCRILFKKNDIDYNLETPFNGNPYKCTSTSCNKYFRRKTYQEESKNGKHYHLESDTKIIKKEVREHIYAAIVELWKKGYNIENIHTITNFSTKLIEEHTRDFRNRYKQTYTFEEFRNILESEIDEQDQNLLSTKEKGTLKIRKALSIGCSGAQIQTILKKSPNTITAARVNKKQSQRRTVKMDKANQTITIVGMTPDRKEEFEEKFKKMNILSPHTT